MFNIGDVKKMQFNDFIQWAFLGVISGGVAILYAMKGTMNELNVKLAVFVERLEHHGELIDKIELRLSEIEVCSKKCINHKVK
jgi:hypothetical protein